MGHFSVLKELLLCICNLPKSFYKECEEPKYTASSLFLSFSRGNRFVDWDMMGKVLILKD